MNKLASAVTAYTPQLPISAEQADEIRALVDEVLQDLSEQVDQKLQAFDAETLGSKEEEVIIILRPPP
jgi:hypothetical protein